MISKIKDVLRDTEIGMLGSCFLVIFAVTDAAYIFSGSLNGYLQSGIILALISTIVLTVVLNLLSSYRLVTASAQDITIVIYAIIFPQIFMQLPSANHSTLLSTYVALVVITSLLVGVVLYLMGHFGLGNIVRFVPYPVMGGFLAGTGWYLLKGAWPTMAVSVDSLQAVASLWTPEVLAKWLPGVVLGILLIFAHYRWRKPFLIQGIFVIAFVLFYLTLYLCHISVKTAMQHGFLLGPFANLRLIDFYQSLSWQAIQWQQIKHVAIYIAAILVLTPISLLLNITGIELDTKTDLDVDKELRASGIANIFSGAMCGGMVGYHNVVLSLLNYRLKAKTRIVALSAGFCCLLILLLGMQALTFIPRFLPAGLLVYFGVDLLITWLISSYRHFSLPEYGVIVFILFVIAVYGFFQGIVSGLIVALTIFAYKYSQVKIIRIAASGRIRQSNVDRDDKIKEILFDKGEQIYILQLQGYLFFGNANNIVKKILSRLTDATLQKLTFIVLDFHYVQGMDSSSELSFIKLITVCEKEKIFCIFSGMPKQVASLMMPHLKENHQPGFAYQMQDLDHALEWCENKLLTQAIGSEDIALSFRHYLKRAIINDNDVDQIIGYLEPVQVPAHYTLFEQDDLSEDMYFIESGKVEIFIRDNHGVAIRLRSMGAGTIIGEVAFYLGMPRTANVRTTEPCSLYRLTAKNLAALEQQQPRLASLLHHYIACQCMLRLSYANRLIQAFSEK